MCGRFNVIDNTGLRALLDELGVQGRPEARFNIAPTDSVQVVIATPQVSLQRMVWWLLPAWAEAPSLRYSMFNARAEHLAHSPAFSQAFAHRRCIFPLSSFIEWQHRDGRQPYEIWSEEGALAVAGIWESWGQGDAVVLSCCMVTVDAVPSFRPIHERMPLMLSVDDARRWLMPELSAAQRSQLLQPRLPAPLCVTMVARDINDSRNKCAPRALGESRVIV